MTDNITVPTNVDGPIVEAWDDLGGVKVPRFKVTFGLDGSMTDVSSSAGLPVTLYSGGAEVLLSPDTSKVDNSAFTANTDRVLPVGYRVDDTSTDLLTENDIGVARITTDRKQIVTEPATTGGSLTTFHLVSAASTNATSVKASAGSLYGWYISNTNAAARYVKFHNTAGTPTAGSGVVFAFGIPGTGGANAMSKHGITFSTGIGISVVVGAADNDSTAVALNDLVINLFYA